MNSPFGRTYRGMQVHAVPEHERAYDPQNGKKLPWGYAVAENLRSDVDNDRSRDQYEKGPFGRSLRRARGGPSRSRSKTAEPSKEGDRVRAEQLMAEDAVFGSLRKTMKEDVRREISGEGDANSVPTPSAQNIPAVEGEKEPTEVLLYGFGEELQWAAIDFYERASDGDILEDYERAPPGQRGQDVFRSFGKVAAQRSLGRTALRKKNRFAGGLHWIKVTFDSRQAAELACASSPHVIRGHLVYAEPYQGRGPGRDEPIMASQAGAQITNDSYHSPFQQIREVQAHRTPSLLQPPLHKAASRFKAAVLILPRLLAASKKVQMSNLQRESFRLYKRTKHDSGVHASRVPFPPLFTQRSRHSCRNNPNKVGSRQSGQRS